MIYVAHMWQQVKASLPTSADATEITRRLAEIWRELPPQKKAVWECAAGDRMRYNQEESSAPQRHMRRTKKHHEAPKRSMSAFLLYSQVMRAQVRSENPDTRNTEISKLLADRWKAASFQEKQPYIELEKEKRMQYKEAMAEWMEAKHTKEEEARDMLHSLRSTNALPCSPYHAGGYTNAVEMRPMMATAGHVHAQAGMAYPHAHTAPPHMNHHAPMAVAAGIEQRQPQASLLGGIPAHEIAMPHHQAMRGMHPASMEMRKTPTPMSHTEFIATSWAADSLHRPHAHSQPPHRIAVSVPQHMHMPQPPPRHAHLAQPQSMQQQMPGTRAQIPQTMNVPQHTQHVQLHVLQHPVGQPVMQNHVVQPQHHSYPLSVAQPQPLIQQFQPVALRPSTRPPPLPTTLSMMAPGPSSYSTVATMNHQGPSAVLPIARANVIYAQASGHDPRVHRVYTQVHASQMVQVSPPVMAHPAGSSAVHSTGYQHYQPTFYTVAHAPPSSTE